MSRFGEYIGYTGKPCVNCGRYRVERYSSGFEICEKCNWCEQLSRYVLDDELCISNSEDKLRLIHDVVAEYIHNNDKTAVDSMEEIIDIAYW